MKQKTCAAKDCEALFTPRNMQHKTCCWQCAIDYTKEVRAKRKTKAKNIAVREFRDNDKTQLKKDVQKIANRIGKLRKMIQGQGQCVTCGIKTGKMDGGHCYATSTYSPIRYYTLQINCQCIRCNQYNGGMPTEYREYLINDLGLEKVLWLESFKGQVTKKHTLLYLQKYKRVMSKRLKVLEKRLKI